jgi:hypothetical protein
MVGKSGQRFFCPKIFFFPTHFNQKIKLLMIPRNQFINLKNSKNNSKHMKSNMVRFFFLDLFIVLDNIEISNNHNPISTNLMIEICENNDFFFLYRILVKISLSLQN